MNKRIVSLLLVLVMVMSLLPAPAMAAEFTPISTQEELAGISNGNYKLTADLELSSDWAVPNLSGGSFDGNGHTITLNGKPLFNGISGGATVSNLVLKGSVSSSGSVGSLANQINDGVVRNCISYADVNYTGNGGNSMFPEATGGFAATHVTGNAVVSNCLYAGTLNKGSAGVYGSIVNKDEFAGMPQIENCVGVGVDRIGTAIGMFGNDPMEVGSNAVAADASAFVPADYLDSFNANRAEGDAEWILAEDGRLTLKVVETVEPEIPEIPEVPQATPEELEALDNAIAAADAAVADKVYATDTWDAFAAALESAKALKESGETEQEKVTKATADLISATEALHERNIDTVSSDGMTVVEVNQGNIKDTLKNPSAGNYYKLTEDITINDPYWGGFAELNAVIDGDGHTITLEGTPLYGSIGADGVIQNLGVLGNAQNGSSDTGALAKDSAGLIINCWSRASVASEGMNNRKKNTGGFVANLTAGGAVVNSYVAGTVSAKGNDGTGVAGALVGTAAGNTLVKNGYFLNSVAGNAVGSSEGNVTGCAAKTRDEFYSESFVAELNAGKGTYGKTWNPSSEGWPHFGTSGDFTPDTGVTLRYTPTEGYGSGESMDFDSKAGLTLSLADVLAGPDVQNPTPFSGKFSYPGFDGEAAFVPQYVSDGQGNHKVFVSEDGSMEILGTGSLEVAVCDKSSWSGTAYDKELTRFKVVVTETQIEDLRLVPTGEYVSDNGDGTYSVAGSGTVHITAQVKLGGNWKVAPAKMYNCTVSGNVSQMDKDFNAKRPGTVQVSATVMGKEATVSVESTYVPVTSITPGPSGKYILHGRNANSTSLGDFLDLTLADGAGTVVVSPDNASYADAWTLESSDPSVAEYVDSMIKAVLPYKAGTVTMTAKVNDPQQSAPVEGKTEVTLEYFNPVTSVSISDAGLSVKENETIDLPLVFNGPKSAEGYHVSEPGMIWTFSGDGEVEITRESLGVLVRTDKEYCIANDQYKLVGIKEGIVTVTGTPVDQTGNAEPVTFDITVAAGTAEPAADNDKIVKEGTAGALAYMQKAYEGWTYRFGDEWPVFIFSRMGEDLTASQKQEYLNSIVKTYEKPKNANLKPTTIARVILAVSALGEDASNLNGVNLIDRLCQGKFMEDGSNEPMWALIALDSRAYEVPAGAKWNREMMLKELLTYQNPTNGGFGLTDNETVSVDITAMAVQALAPYYDTNENVKTAVDRALSYLKHEMNRNCDYGTSESISQVIIALAVMNRDPVDQNNGFVKSPARNLITALNAYRMDDGGYRHLLSEKKSQNMSTTQALLAFEAYRRVKAGENSLYDMTNQEVPDRPVDPDKPVAPDQPTVPDETKPSVPDETKPGQPDETKPVKPGTNPTEPGSKPTQPTKPNGNRPATGDNNNVMFYGVVLVVAVAGIVVLLLWNKKKHNDK